MPHPQPSARGHVPNNCPPIVPPQRRGAVRRTGLAGRGRGRGCEPESSAPTRHRERFMAGLASPSLVIPDKGRPTARRSGTQEVQAPSQLPWVPALRSAAAGMTRRGWRATFSPPRRVSSRFGRSPRPGPRSSTPQARSRPRRREPLPTFGARGPGLRLRRNRDDTLGYGVWAAAHAHRKTCVGTLSAIDLMAASLPAAQANSRTGLRPAAPRRPPPRRA